VRSNADELSLHQRHFLETVEIDALEAPHAAEPVDQLADFVVMAGLDLEIVVATFHLGRRPHQPGHRTRDPLRHHPSREHGEQRRDRAEQDEPALRACESRGLGRDRA